jgi:hypothetical protein
VNLAHHWDYVLDVAAQRLQNNKTPRHVAKYGDELEIMGAAGELAARIFLGVSLTMGVHFDGGVDIEYGRHNIDVKATKITPGIAYRYLQWPIWKPVISDVILMTVVNTGTKHATIIGYALKTDLECAVANMARETPCVEIAFSSLRPAWELVAERELGSTCSIVGQAKLGTPRFVGTPIQT